MPPVLQPGLDPRPATLDPFPMRIAIDTNILIAALVRPEGTSAGIVQAWRAGALEVVTSDATMREAEAVLGAWLARMTSREAVAQLLDDLRKRTVRAEDPPRITDLRLKDPGDLRLVEAAVAAGAAYIVTTDREFLSRRGYGGVEFVTPEDFQQRMVSGYTDT